MKNSKMPEGFHTVTPYYIVPDLSAFLDFLGKAFGAETTLHEPGKHAEARIGDSMIMAGQEKQQWKAAPASTYLYVDDCDAWYRRALDAGATSQMEPADHDYGDRNGGVIDRWGNTWWIATRL
ncbi:MAG: VOC family protein [Acidobacteria bacterium]|nr:VOC family protein [Acidobacteriota bacterium]